MSQRILVVEDDLDIQELTKEFLSANEYIVDTANDGEQGYLKFKDGNYDLVMLDVNMPKMDGFTVCKMIRQKSMVPIIMLTALEEEQDQLKGFENGADDYITKPFSFNLLIKRVEAVLRRGTSENEAGNIIRFKDLEMDIDAYTVKISGERIETTSKEFQILQTMLESKGKVWTREALLDRVWGYDFFGDARVIDTHIKNVRRKLDRPYIQTVKGIGYKVED
ncbi:MAG: two-component response regulator [Bacillales bacterium]|jgi:two-component system response regulator VanR|nr:two-component response regulator [Bacillales bacterium]